MNQKGTLRTFIFFQDPLQPNTRDTQTLLSSKVEVPVAYRVLQRKGISSPKGVVFVINGGPGRENYMAKRSEWLMDNDYIVILIDQRGNGSTIPVQSDFNYLGLNRMDSEQLRNSLVTTLLVNSTSQNAYDTIAIADHLMQSRFSEFPYTIIGHSYGSTVLNKILEIYGRELKNGSRIGSTSTTPTIRPIFSSPTFPTAPWMGTWATSVETQRNLFSKWKTLIQNEFGTDISHKVRDLFARIEQLPLNSLEGLDSEYVKTMLVATVHFALGYLYFEELNIENAKKLLEKVESMHSSITEMDPVRFINEFQHSKYAHNLNYQGVSATTLFSDGLGQDFTNALFDAVEKIDPEAGPSFRVEPNLYPVLMLGFLTDFMQLDLNRRRVFESLRDLKNQEPERLPTEDFSKDDFARGLRELKNIVFAGKSDAVLNYKYFIGAAVEFGQDNSISIGGVSSDLTIISPSDVAHRGLWQPNQLEFALNVA